MNKEQRNIIIELMEGYTHYRLDSDKDNSSSLNFIQDEETITFNTIEEFKNFKIEENIYMCLEDNGDIK